MSEALQIAAERRERAGKGAARQARREGKVPGVIYGGGEAPEIINVSFNTMLKQSNTGRFLSTLYKIEMDGKETLVIPRDLQLDVVNDRPIHVDFLRMDENSQINLNIAVRFINEDICPGLKAGGVLNVVRYEIELMCPALRIPEEIVIDLAEIESGESLHISGVTLPDGCTPTITDRDFTVITIAAPSGSAADDEEETEAEEGVEAEGGEEAAEGASEES